MARSPVTNVVEQYNALSEVEQKVFLDLVDPQPEPEAPAVKTRKKRASKSAKAQSLSSAIAKVPKVDTEADEAAERAKEIISPKCNICGHPEDYQDHFQPSPNYHDPEFPKVKKAGK